jgi:hypothetical protein
MLVQDIEVQLVRPPVSVRPASAGCLWVWYARYWVFPVVCHNVTSFRCLILSTVVPPII